MLRLQGSGLCDLKSGRVSLSAQIDSYLEADARSETLSPSQCAPDYPTTTKGFSLGSHFQWCFGLT